MQKLMKVLCVILIIFISLSAAFGGYVAYEYVMYKKNALKDITVVAMVRNGELMDKDFVDVSKYIPEIKIDLRYATTNNITGTVLYSSKTAYLRKGTADKLKKANEEFSKYGYVIKIWDAYRPRSVQYKLWAKIPDQRYIANPNRGSGHNRGTSVDITLIDKAGNEMKMPTDFDGFGPKSYRDCSDLPDEEKSNVKFLGNIMAECGFRSIETEWWHFDDTDFRNYPVVDSIKNEDDANRSYDVNVSGNEIDYSAVSGKENFAVYFVNDLLKMKYETLKYNVKCEIDNMKQMIDIFNSKV